MHRAHFPELIKTNSDVKFGLAIYISEKNLPKDQQEILLRLLKEESEYFSIAEYPIEYFVVDAGSGALYISYLTTRIIKEVFKVDLELSDEGILPYHYNLDIPIPKRSDN